MKRFINAILFVCMLGILGIRLLWLASPLQAAMLSVPSSKYPTIQEAIDLAGEGDKILISPGIYFENLVIEGKSLHLTGTGRDKTILDGGNKAPCIYPEKRQ